MYEKNFQIDLKKFHKSIDIVDLTVFDAIATPIGGFITLPRSFWCMTKLQQSMDSWGMAHKRYITFIFPIVKLLNLTKIHEKSTSLNLQYIII